MATSEGDGNDSQCPMLSKTLSGPSQSLLFGNLLQIDANTHLSWTKWSKEFGSIYKVSFGPMGNAVVFSGVNELAAAFEPESENDNTFSDRWRPPVLEKIGYAGSISWENWLEGAKQRKHLMKEVFRSMDIEGLLKKEVDAVCDVLSNKEQVDVCELLNQANNNILLSLTLNRGDRYEYNDDEFKILSEVITSNHNRPVIASPMNYVQCLWHTPLYNTMRRNYKCLKSTLQPYIDSHRADFDSENIRDLIDGYLGGIEETSFDVQEAIDHIKFLFPPACSLRVAMQWVILFVTRNDDVQKKIQEEIDQVLTDADEVNDEVVTNKMPYINAVIKESLRLATPVVQLIPHCAIKDTNFKGYEIKKDTIIIPNLWGPNHDPENWVDPFVFKPDRWLNVDNLPPGFMPFGSGLRKCDGYLMSMTALRILTATVFKRFHLKGVEGEKLPSLEDSFMLVGCNHPNHFNVIATNRH
ncbi:steroid 17-alpha-hydroxylase/17,20 lyase-like [Anneissia japonica]|uniref:steroid 17-alpha-hydroxylase/17,20 lyase-like n=1 Tax=Anneissia japonica TaxID=1529436 RepID=UPI00142567DF|nr:steroid 17-alpha-hydroxylase/17,20 lyase-like [Anneissia japonica]